MNFLADESVAWPIIVALRDLGFEVRPIIKERPGIPDEQVIHESARVGFILLTQDRDFGELAVRFEEPVVGVILLELERLPLAAQVRRTLECLSDTEVMWLGYFSVVEPGRLRQRALASAHS